MGVTRDDDAAHIWDSATAAVKAALATDLFDAAWLSGTSLSPADAARRVLADR